jgi:hypothetical protein
MNFFAALLSESDSDFESQPPTSVVSRDVPVVEELSWPQDSLHDGEKIVGKKKKTPVEIKKIQADRAKHQLLMEEQTKQTKVVHRTKQSKPHWDVLAQVRQDVFTGALPTPSEIEELSTSLKHDKSWTGKIVRSYDLDESSDAIHVDGYAFSVRRFLENGRFRSELIQKYQELIGPCFVKTFTNRENTKYIIKVEIDKRISI